MPRGNVNRTKVFLQGKEEDFIVFVDSVKDLEAWKNDRSIPLAQVVAGFKIMVSHKCDTTPFPLISSTRKTLQWAGYGTDTHLAGMELKVLWTVPPRRL